MQMRVPFRGPGRQTRSTRGKWLVACILMLAGAAFAAVLFLRPEEPSYNGIPASQWAMRIKLASPDDPGVKALIEIGPPAIPSILQAYEGTPLQYRRADWYRKCYDAIPVLIKKWFPSPVDPPSSAAKAGMISTLTRIRIKTEGVEDFLLRRTASSDEQVRTYACESLGRLGYDSERSIKRLKSLLGDSSGLVRFHALRGLHQLNALNDPNLISALENLSKGEDQGWGRITRGLALCALWDLKAPNSQENLADFLSTADERTLVWPAARLRDRGELAGVFAPVLSERLASATNNYVREELRKALKSIIKERNKILPRNRE